MITITANSYNEREISIVLEMLNTAQEALAEYCQLNCSKCELYKACKDINSTKMYLIANPISPKNKRKE